MRVGAAALLLRTARVEYAVSVVQLRVSRGVRFLARLRFRHSNAELSGGELRNGFALVNRDRIADYVVPHLNPTLAVAVVVAFEGRVAPPLSLAPSAPACSASDAQHDGSDAEWGEEKANHGDAHGDDAK